MLFYTYFRSTLDESLPPINHLHVRTYHDTRNYNRNSSRTFAVRSLGRI